MIDLPRYARRIAEGTEEDDEIVLLTERTQTLGAAVGYKARRLNGESLTLRASGVRVLELPDPRPRELFFVASVAEYNSSHREDITFGKNTVIIVSKEVDDNWYEGTVIGDNAKRLGRAGLFPKSFVVRLDISGRWMPTYEPPAVSSRDSAILEQTAAESTDGVKFRSSPAKTRSVVSSWVESAADGEASASLLSKMRAVYDMPLDSSQPPDRTIGLASVQFDFVAREIDELSVRAGESVSVIEMVNEEWARCYDPATNRTGIVPTAFLQLFLNEDEEDNDDESVSGAGSSENETGGGGLRMRDELISRPGGISPSVVASSSDEPHRLPTLARSSLTDSSFADSEAITLQFLRGISFDVNDLDAIFGFSGSSPSTTPQDFGVSKPPARPPPPRFSPTKQLKQTAPPRPTTLPQRMSTLLPSPLASPSEVRWQSSERLAGTPQAEEGLPLSPDEMLTKKRKIAEDLIATELQYLSDIGMWEVEILQSAAISSDQKKFLTNGTPQLKALSRSLVELLVEQQNQPPESQCYGLVFMQLRDEFWRTFGFHFRCVEAMSGIVEGKDSRLQEALSACVAEMRALGSNVFDVPTAVSRPIQRCLKYPLFIGELIKNTPISHVDHPKLMEALKQMSQLASKMNESKRRKELAVKYREGENSESLAQRLSKLNVHSVKKKSTRFKYRLSSQIGLVHVQRDATFDTLVESLDVCQRRVCKLLHAVQVYKRLISTQTRKYVDTHTASTKLALNTDNLNAQIRGYCKRLLQETANVVFFMDSSVASEAKKFLRLPVTKVIQKRYDKLIDFLSAKKADKSPEDIRLKQCDYEALNAQLKSTLPKVIESMKTKTLKLIESAIAKDEQLFSDLDQLWECMSREAREYFGVSFGDFAEEGGRRMRSFRSLRKAALGDAANARDNDAKGALLGRAQTEHEREALVRILRAQGDEAILMRVKQRWPQTDSFTPVDDKPPLRVEVGDVVMLIQKGILDEPWLCDNGVYKGYLPGTCLEKFVHQNGNSTTARSEKRSPVVAEVRNSPVPEVKPISPEPKFDWPNATTTSNPVLPSSAKKGDELSLIDLEDNLLDFTSPTAALQTIASRVPTWTDAVPQADSRPQMTLSPLNPFFVELVGTGSGSPVAKIPTLIPQPLSGPPMVGPQLENSLQKSAAGETAKEGEYAYGHLYEAPPITFAGDVFFDAREEDCATPLRAAPLPPINERSELAERNDESPPLLSEPYKVEFGFTATDVIHASITEGDQVEVLKKSDDSGNSEWWLVRTADGAVGFVPANYLHALL